VKVLVDTNVLLSYLLDPDGESAPVQIVERLFLGEVEAAFPG
jgi:predicted nucleic acid-binding protein